MKKTPTPVELLHECTRKEQAFILALVADPTLSQREAFYRAGFTAGSHESADANASRLLRKDRVRQALDALRAKILSKTVVEAELTAQRVIQEVARLAFVDPTGVLDDSGNLKPFSGWTEAQRAALASFEVIIKNKKAGDGETDTVHKVKMADKLRALELGARILKLTEKQQVDDGVDWHQLAARLASARQRER